jgi:hypothetical protein
LSFTQCFNGKTFRKKIGKKADDKNGKERRNYRVALAEEICAQEHRQVEHIQKCPLIDNKKEDKTGDGNKQQDDNQLFIDVEIAFER